MKASQLPLLLLLVALVLCGAPSSLVRALCPSNGNTHAIYVTSNMGDNVWSFDTQGNFIGNVLNTSSLPPDVKVSKLRAMRFGPGGYLYLSSARGSYSRIFAVSGNGVLNKTLGHGCTRDYQFTVLQQDKDNPFLDHPYDMAFHPITHDLFVSNQNTITITKYTFKGKSGSNPREYSWVPIANHKNSVPADRNTSLEAETPVTFPSDAGVFASSWNTDYTLSSTRGVAISPFLPRSIADGTFTSGGLYTLDDTNGMYYLLVCDPASNTVHVFDPESGDRLFGINIPSPVQVSFPARYYDASGEATATGARKISTPYIYVTSRDDGMAYLVRFGPTNTGNGLYGGRTEPRHPYRITPKAPMAASSGLYENPSREVLLIADRVGRRITSHASPFVDDDYKRGNGPAASLGSFVTRLPDQPEFILSALLEHQRSIPFCYELAPSGKLRYVALCSVAYIWSVVLLAFLIAVPIVLFSGHIRRLLTGVNKESRVGFRGEAQPLLDGDHDTGYGTVSSKSTP